MMILLIECSIGMFLIEELHYIRIDIIEKEVKF